MAAAETQRVALAAALAELQQQDGVDDLIVSPADEQGRVAIEGVVDVAELVRAILRALL